MIDLRKTYCRLDSEHIEQYKQLIRGQGLISISGKYVDGMTLDNLQMCLTVNKTNSTHCDPEWFCNELGHTEFKGIKEEGDNKHPHHDLIVEWAKDTSKKIEASLVSVKPHSVDITKVINDTNGEFEFRIKPEREFIEGHWYPCVYEDMKGVVKCVGDDKFVSNTIAPVTFTSNDFEWVGESLGPINFGDCE